MSICRVWYHKDGKVSVSYPDTRYKFKPRNLNLDQWAYKQFDDLLLKCPQFLGLDYEDIDSYKLPKEREDRDRWRGNKTTGIKIDSKVILRKDIQQKLDKELSKSEPNVIKAMKLQRKLDKQEHDD
jgi:hypothetical protein